MSSKKYCPSGNTDIISFYLLISGRYSSLSAYGQSKLANILHANELAKRLKVSIFFINLNRNQKLFVTAGQLCHIKQGQKCSKHLVHMMIALASKYGNISSEF